MKGAFDVVSVNVITRLGQGRARHRINTGHKVRRLRRGQRINPHDLNRQIVIAAQIKRRLP